MTMRSNQWEADPQDTADWAQAACYLGLEHTGIGPREQQIIIALVRKLWALEERLSERDRPAT
jgi:hypothetical protein